jgi:nucleoside 2-deoxyribosyltransferase
MFSYLQDQIVRGLVLSHQIPKGFVGKKRTYPSGLRYHYLDMKIHSHISNLPIDEILPHCEEIKFPYERVKEKHPDYFDDEINKDGSFKKDFFDKADIFSLSIWYMYNGATQQDTCFINVDRAFISSLKLIVSWLKTKFDISCVANKESNVNSGFPAIEFNEKNTIKLWRTIDKFVLEPMWYKIGDRDKNKLIYLCGPMEYAADCGVQWRKEFSEVLAKKNYRCISPNEEEEFIKKKYKVDAETKKNNIDEYISGIREFITLDLTFVESADMLVCKWEGEQCSGTIHEVGYARQISKPSYLITSKPLYEVPGWFLSCFTKCFKTIDELINFLEGK